MTDIKTRNADWQRLETAGQGQGLRRIAIEPLTRVEGHGKVTLLLDDAGHVAQARLHIVEFRGFERFIQGRPYWELPIVVQRLCGICPVSHHLAAAKAVDQLVGVGRLPPRAEKTRRLLHFGQVLQSHALHFFHLSAPDLIFGSEDPVAHRNIVGLVEEDPELARRGILIRRFGQQLIQVIAGKRIHGILATPGGVNKGLTPELLAPLRSEVEQIVRWCRDSVGLARDLYLADPRAAEFGTIASNMLGMVGSDGTLELYHGGLRATGGDGALLFDQHDYRDYAGVIAEQVKSWSYLKFPFLRELGPEQGLYRVGPLARVNLCDRIATPLAEQARQELFGLTGERPLQATLAYHWTRLIEALYCAEAIAELFDDEALYQGDLQAEPGDLREHAIGALEAPRGTLIHDYRIDAQGLVESANLIVSTTNNNAAMNASIRRVARDELNGQEITEPLLNRIEMAVRAYDPCISCATHAVGRMPLIVELRDSAETLLDSVARDGDGVVRHGVEHAGPACAHC
jgi:NAD-reducing hydrogenase large subunit